jgi:uncharacterized protein YlxP (DUF503 family)
MGTLILNMVVGVAKIKINLFECNSLKEKRSILTSLIAKIRNNFPVSIAEVDKNDVWHKSVIGISLVSNDSSVIDSIFNKIIHFIDRVPLLEIIHTDFEFIHIN